MEGGDDWVRDSSEASRRSPDHLLGGFRLTDCASRTVCRDVGKEVMSLSPQDTTLLPATWETPTAASHLLRLLPPSNASLHQVLIALLLWHLSPGLSADSLGSLTLKGVERIK